MSLSARRLRSIGWLALLAVCGTLVMVLTLRVNALRSQVRREENRIVALREETMYLQTEFETRASQQQLKAWNDVDFGFVAPAAGQYLENERQLASLGKPVGPDAPAPVQVAELGEGADGGPGLPAMVSPLTGRPAGSAVRSDAVARDEHAGRLLAAAHDQGTTTADGPDRAASHAAAAAALGERLGNVDHGASGKPAHAGAHKPAAKHKSPAKPKPKAATKPRSKAAAKPGSKKAGPHKPKAHSSESPA